MTVQPKQCFPEHVQLDNISMIIARSTASCKPKLVAYVARHLQPGAAARPPGRLLQYQECPVHKDVHMLNDLSDSLGVLFLDPYPAPLAAALLQVHQPA